MVTPESHEQLPPARENLIPGMTIEMVKNLPYKEAKKAVSQIINPGK